MTQYAGLLANFVCALAFTSIGFIVRSWWFITVGAYYAVLAAARFSVLKIKRGARGDLDLELFSKKVTGILLIVLSFCLVGVNILAAIKDRGTVFHEIVMIAIATYTCAKVTLAIIDMVKARKIASPAVKTLRSISLSEAIVSIYTLQRSMLVSFPGMSAPDIQLFNILTGTATWLTVLLLGINLTGGKRINMAKSKLVQANEKIAKSVTGGYKKIEKGVVDGYKKIEKGVVDGYTKIEDKFIDAYLTKDGETVEEAKARLKKENKQ